MHTYYVCVAALFFVLLPFYALILSTGEGNGSVKHGCDNLFVFMCVRAVYMCVVCVKRGMGTTRKEMPKTVYKRTGSCCFFLALRHKIIHTQDDNSLTHARQYATAKK